MNSNLQTEDLVEYGIDILLGYAVVLAAYTILTYIQYTIRYHMAKKSVRGYYEELTKLEKMYNREEKKPSGFRN